MSNKKISYDDILRNMGTYVVDGKLYIIQNAKTEQQEYEQSKIHGDRGRQRQMQVPPSPSDTSYAPIMQSNSNLSSNFRDKFIKPMQAQGQGQQGTQGQQGMQGQPMNKNQAIQNYLNMIKSKNHVKNVKSKK